MKLYDLKVNHLKNPLGFRMERTVFTWKTAEMEGRKQVSARIRVALDSAMENILADTGFDNRADSLGTSVHIPLYPRTRYWWTVTVRTDAGEETESPVQWFETGKRDEAWDAKWITCDNTEPRHPFFEKEITPGKTVARARFYICGLGLYEAFYNGKRIGNEYLTPYCSDYNEWVQYQTYDVTEELKSSGKLSILLGNGWYKGRFGFDAAGKGGFYGNEWKLIAELRILYEDGTEQVIGTDESWAVRRSTITFSNIYDGEHRDDTIPELPPESALLCDAPKGTLTDRMSLPVTVHEHMEPKELIHTPAGETVLDMGQEFTGIFTLNVHEPEGTLIHIQTGEILQGGNFYNENLRSAKSEYYFVTDGRDTVLKPHFTFYGYRYVKIEGITDLKKEDFTGLALYSDVEMKGNVTTGHDLVNRLISNVRWGMKGNFADVPTDCPQRDERMGWTADTQVFVPTATYLADTYAFYAKYLYDMKLEQAVRAGRVPDVVPSFSVETTASVWGDAACIIPWTLYEFYGDVSILEDQYESMKSWVDFIGTVDGENHGWRDVFHYGDWLALDNPNGKEDSVLGGTDEGFIANIYYAASAGLVANAAAVLGKTEDEKTYRKLSDEQFDAVKQEYYSPLGRCCVNTQTAHLLTLKYHLSNDEEKIRKNLRKLFLDSGDKLKTGFVGTPLLGNILTENGFSDLAYKLLLNEETPGWLHEILLGATTVWERWNSVLDDGSISSTGMNSLNHYAYGSVLEWVFRHAAGLDFDPDVPGCRRALLAPLPEWHLREASAEYNSPAGKYTVSWKIPDKNHVEIGAEIPFGCEGYLTLPHAPESLFTEGGNPVFDNVKDHICILGPGKYTVSYETDRPLKKIYHADMSVQELLSDPESREVLERIIPGAESLPKQFISYTLRQINEKLDTHISEESIRELDRALREL